MVYKIFEIYKVVMLKIGILDDEPEMTDLLKESVSIIGAEVFATTNGLNFLKYLENEHPDVVILDLMMPVIHGIDVLYIMKSKYPKTKTIVLSGTSESRSIRESVLLCDMYISKPFRTKELIESIELLLGLTEIPRFNESEH